MADHLLRYRMMSILVSSKPLAPDIFKEMLSAHRLFIRSGGGGGRWQTVVTPGGEETGVILGIYRPVSADTRGKQADLTHKRLTGLKLSKIQLSYANMCGVFAQSQDFSQANLEGSLMTDADFSRSCFRGAKLARTDFSRSNLAGCDMREADLRNADFEWADLRDADLTGADITGVRFVNTCLKGARINAVPLLWQASRDGNADALEQALDLGADVNARGQFGDSALNLAAENGHSSIAVRLLDAGADMENKGGADHTPLMQAAFGGHVEVVQMLIERGALISRSLLSGLQTKVSILEENTQLGMVNPKSAQSWRQFLEYMVIKYQAQNPVE